MTASCICPHCGGTGRIAAIDTAGLVELLRADCEALGITIAIGGSITEGDLARLLGRKPGTLRNWRSTAQPIRFQRIAGRVRYRLDDVAEWLVTKTDVNGEI